MKLSEAINKALTSKRVHVLYAGRDTVNIWNSMRAAGDPPLFCGWYWAHGWKEGGPFRCESAAMRDAWYRVVLGQEPPRVIATRQMKAELRLAGAGNVVSLR